MQSAEVPPSHSEPALKVFFLGQVAFDVALQLQQQLAWETRERGEGHVTLLLCEHQPLVSIGRAGSRADVRLSDEELARQQLEIRWVSRGGGAIFHAPGQLAVYPIVSLFHRQWSIGQFADHLQTGIAAAMADLGFRGRKPPNRFGLWGRTGQIVAFGLAVKHEITQHGAFINISPTPGVLGYVDTNARDAPPDQRRTMSSLLSEQGRPGKMTAVRSRLVEHLASAFACNRQHLFTGHPLLQQLAKSSREPDLPPLRTADPFV